MDVVDRAMEVMGGPVAPVATHRNPRGQVDPVMARFGAIVPVLGAHGQVGASGVALALADAAALVGLRVLLVDAADPGRSGLAGVCHVEGRSIVTGADRAAVRVATRYLGRVAVDVRRLVGTGLPLTVSAVPLRRQWAASVRGPVDLTVVDVGWDVWRLMTANTELGPLAWCQTGSAMVRPVLVVRPTMPSVGVAEAVIARYARGQLVDLAPLAGLLVVGASTWPTTVVAALGHLMRQAAPHALFIPHDPNAAMHGWSTRSLPAAITTAVAGLLRGLGGRYAEAAGPPPARRSRLLRRP